MKIRTKNVLMVMCSLVLVASCAMVALRYTSAKVLVNRLHMRNGFVQIVLGDNTDLMTERRPDGETQPGEVPVDWKALYPFYAEDDGVFHEQSVAFGTNIMERMTHKIQSKEKKVENWTSGNFWHYMTIVQPESFNEAHQ